MCVCILYRTIEEYMNEQVKYVITQEEWDDNFDKVRGSWEGERKRVRE